MAPPNGSSRARRVIKALLAFVVIPLVVGVIAVFVLANTEWGNEKVRGIMVSQANGRINGKLSIARLRGNLFSGATLTDVRIVDSLNRPVFSTRKAEVRYDLWAALRGRVVVRSVALDTPVVVFDKRPGQRWNFQSLMRPSGTKKTSSGTSLPPELSDISIRHGQFLYRRPWSPDTTLTGRQRDSVIASALGTEARKRTERVDGGFQRVLDYHDINARLASVAIGKGATPTIVNISSLSMVAEPYRPPAIDIRSLIGTLYASKDSLWWRGAKMVMPASNVSGDGTIGFHRSGFRLDLTGSPIALADLRWLKPTLSTDGGGRVRYQMRLQGDTAEWAVSDADLHYGKASLVGNASVARVKPKGGTAGLFVKGVDVTIAQLSTAMIQELAPKLKLRRAGVIGGHVVASGPTRAMQLDADVNFDDAISGRSRVTANGNVAFDTDVRARDLVVRLLPLRLATVEGAGVKVPVDGTLTGELTVSGAAKEGWTVRGDLAHADRGERSRVVGSGQYLLAGKRIVADATLRPLSLVTIGRLAPKAGLRGSVTGDVHATGTTRDLRVSGNLRAPGGGSAAFRSALALAGRATRYDISAVLDALNANAFSTKAPVTRLSGTVAARGRGTDLATANAAVAVDLARSSYDTFAVERLYGRARLASGLLNLDSLAAVASGVHASAKGTLGLTRDKRGELQFAASTDSLSLLSRFLGAADTGVVRASATRRSALLAAARADSARRADALRIEQIALGLPEGVALRADTLPSIRKDSLAGSLKAAGVLSGNVKELGVDATIEGSGLVVRGYAARMLAARIKSADALDRKIPLSFSATIDSAQASGQSYDLIRASGTWLDKRVAGAIDVKQDALVSYAALGSYAKPAKGVHDIRLDSLRAQFDTLVWRLARPAGVRFANDDAVIDSLDLRSSVGGRLFANGVAPKDGNMRLAVAAENVRVSTVLRALQRDVSADGLVNLSVNATGTRAAPSITGNATLRDARYKETRAPDADVGIRYAAQRLGLDLTARDSTGRRVLEGNALLPMDLSLTAPNDKERLIAGPLVANVRMDSLSLATLPLSSHRIEDVHGMVAGDAQVSGTWKKPAYLGRVSLRGGGLKVPDAATGMRVSDAVADVRLTADSIILDSLTARAKGLFRASGSVDLADRAHPYANFVAGGRDLRVFDSPRGLVDADVSVVARGPLDSVRVTGNGEMKGGYLALKQFRKDLLRVKSPGDLAFFTVYDTSATTKDSIRAALARATPKKFAVIADLDLVIDHGNYYRNRPDANTEFFTGEGEIVRAHLDQRSGDSWAVGYVRIGDGAAYFRTRAFIPARGALTFTPHTKAPAMVQQVGEHVVWEAGRGLFPLQLLTGGTSTGPAVGLEAGTLFPIRGRELNGYLTMGRLSTSLLQQSGSSLSGSTWSGQLTGETGALAHRQQGATALGVVLHDIGTGATKEYGLDAFSVSPADVPTELVFGKTGGVRGALIEGGKYVRTDLYVAGQLRFTTGIPGFRVERKFGTDFRLDVGLEPRFLFIKPEELGITHPTKRTGVFGAFLTRLWDF